MITIFLLLVVAGGIGYAYCHAQRIREDKYRDMIDEHESMIQDQEEVK